MFSQVIARKCLLDNRFDCGLLAELMLFYQNPILLLDRPTLISLVDNIEPDILFKLIDRFGLKISYMQETLGTLTTVENNIIYHQFSEFKFRSPKQKRADGHGEIEDVLTRHRGANRATKSLIRNINSRISIHKFGSQDRNQVRVSLDATEGLINFRATEDSVFSVLDELGLGSIKKQNWRFRPIVFDDEKFVIETNFDFDILNSEYKRLTKTQDHILTPAYLINHIFEAHADAYISSQYMAPLCSNAVHTSIAHTKFKNIFSRYLTQEESLSLFQHTELEGANIRDAINSGRKNMHDFCILMSRASKFKSWLNSLNPDEDILKQYIKEIQKDNWFDRLPNKLYRWSAMNTIGLGLSFSLGDLTGLIAGQAISAADTFMLEKILKGWKPSHFVYGKLVPFVKV